MYCNQCEETIGPCSSAGVCGKNEEVSNLQDNLIAVTRLVAKNGENTNEENRYIIENLFVTITNVNFNAEDIKKRIANAKEFINFSEIDLNFQKDENEDINSLKEILLYGLKGMAAYLYHADILGYLDKSITNFIRESLNATVEEQDMDKLTELVFKCGEFGVKAMELLDKANTSTYGNPRISNVNIGVRNNPAILISGHDLKDLKELLEQTKNTGVDVYTHGEMLPAHFYPELNKYEHLVGNYGGSWWKQADEFEKFNGCILMTTNCLVPPKNSYKDRVYTTGPVSFDGVTHIENGVKDFSQIIEHAKTLNPPTELEQGSITGGFARDSLLSNADKIIQAVKTGSIRKFIVMAGCDGRHKERDYYTQFAKKLPSDTVILTAGCAKYRYNKLNLGEIEGIPRVVDAGQCNDSYSLVALALNLKKILQLNDINELPIEYNIAWYEQKAVLVLLSLLHLGVKNIKLGPRLPAFISQNVLKLLQEKFAIEGIKEVNEDIPSLTY